MTFYEKLQRLVDWDAEPHARVLSLYLDISPGHEENGLSFAESELDELATRLDEEDEKLAEIVRSFAAALPAEVEQARAAEYDGLGVFLCVAPALREVFRLRFAFENQAIVDRHPHLRQLLFYEEEYEQTVAVTLGEPEALVVDLHVGDAVAVHRVRPTHGRSHDEELLAMLHRRLAEHPRCHLILLGEPARRGAIEARLDEGLAARVIDRVDEALAPGDPRYLRQIHRSLQAYERRSEAEGIREVERKKLAGEPVATKLGEVLEAINRGTVRKLYMLQGYTARGWVCDACDCMGPLDRQATVQGEDGSTREVSVRAVPPACVACGASVSVVRLEEHMLDQAHGCGAEIETVFDSVELAALGGVAAEVHAAAQGR